MVKLKTEKGKEPIYGHNRKINEAINQIKPIITEMKRQ